jgi:hypothetical protein
MQEFIARSCSDMPLNKTVSAEIVGFMPGIEQLIWVAGL